LSFLKVKYSRALLLLLLMMMMMMVAAVVSTRLVTAGVTSVFPVTLRPCQSRPERTNDALHTTQPSVSHDVLPMKNLSSH